MEQRIGGWIQTYSGERIWPLDPRAEEIHAVDIAHSLSMQCRFNGHTKVFYCVTPETRVLTANFDWKPAGQLVLGEWLVGFDENTPGTRTAGKDSKNGVGKADRRKLRPAQVLHNGLITRPVYRLVLSDDTELFCSADHPWLISTKQSRNQRWEKTETIASAVNGTHKVRNRDRSGKRYLLRFMHPWERIESYEAGYLAGVFDGEGHISNHSGKALSLGFAQKDNPVLAAAKDYSVKYGFSLREVVHATDVHQLCVNGGWQEIFRLIGSLQPKRLLQKARSFFLEGQISYQFPSVEMLEVVSAEYQGESAVIALETSTHTYFAEGFGAHNSVAEHCCHVHDLLPAPLKRAGLLHDASEAYLCDLPRPLKKSPGFGTLYQAVERELEATIAARFGFDFPLPPEVHDADARLLATEAAQLMTPLHPAWPDHGAPVEGLILPRWTPARARTEFLARFTRLESLREWERAKAAMANGM